VFALLCVIVVASQFIPAAVTAQSFTELIKNGGFETGDFENWNADNGCTLMYSSASTDVTAHSGNHFVRAGTTSMSGTLSQMCKIPAKSTSTLSFWYYVGKGCTLEAKVVRMKDKSVVTSWSLAGASWQSVKHDLGLGLANEEVMIEFTGSGYLEEVLIQVWHPILRIFTYRIEYVYHFAYIDDVSLAARLAVYETKIAVNGLPRDLSARITVDGHEKDRIREGATATYTFNLGEAHRIEIESYLAGEKGIRYYCEPNSISISSDTEHVFQYVKQCFLKVDSKFGSCKGEGWYDAGTNTTVSVSPSSVAMSGVLGGLGARYVFRHWAGDISTGSTETMVVIDKPKDVYAVWEEDYSQPMTILAVVVALGLIALILSAVYIRKRKARKRDALPKPS